MRTMRYSVLALASTCLLLLSACGPAAGGEGDGNPSQYQIAFTVNGGGRSVAYTWPAVSQNTGFSNGGGYYFCIFSADGEPCLGDFPRNRVYVRLNGSSVGTHTSADGITGLTLYDGFGSQYAVDEYDTSTYASIAVSIDSKGFFRGTFDGMLVTYNAGLAYIRVSGSIFSYFE